MQYPCSNIDNVHWAQPVQNVLIFYRSINTHFSVWYRTGAHVLSPFKFDNFRTTVSLKSSTASCHTSCLLLSNVLSSLQCTLRNLKNRPCIASPNIYRCIFAISFWFKNKLIFYLRVFCTTYLLLVFCVCFGPNILIQCKLTSLIWRIVIKVP